MDPKNLPGSIKAAILIQSMGEEESQKFLNNLSNVERGVIESHLSQMGEIPTDLMGKIVAEFTELVGRGNPRPGNDTFMTDKGQEKKDYFISSNSESSNLKALQSLKPDHLVELIKDEYPQTIAIILAHLKPEAASEVLNKLPDEIKTDVALRIANLDKIKPEMIVMINKIFEDVVKNKESSASFETGGIRCLAEILNQMGESSGELILNEIEEDDPELAAQIKQGMFVFEDLILVDDKGLQKVLRKVESKELAVALKAASEGVKDKIFRNMSERASEMLKEEIDALGAVRRKKIEKAQQTLTKIVQDMESKGELIISGRRGDEIIG